MRERLLESFQGLIDTIVGLLPQVVVGIVLLIAGIFVAKLIEKILRIFLVRLKFDNLLEKAGLDKSLQRMGIRQELNHFLPRLVYFLLLFVLAKTLTDSLGLVAISDALGAFFAYVPNIVAALLVLVLGTAVAQFAGDMVKNAGESAGLDFAPSLGRAVSALLVFIVAVMAISQLNFDTEMLRIVTSFIMGAGALAFGISFGFGARDVTRNVLAGFYARKLFQVGEPLEVAGQQGVLSTITATHAVLASEGRNITIANTTFLEQVTKQ